MTEAFSQAQQTFKYFWREMSWEYRRIVPGLSVACVKVAFSQSPDSGGEDIVEHMWINDIQYDGEMISGVLINKPNYLTNVSHGDKVQVPLSRISDWLFALQGKTYGGFTIQAMRSDMSLSERKEHDAAWGLDFGEPDDILIVYQQKEHPENLTEHPMSISMKKSFADMIQKNPAEIRGQDQAGHSWLHSETIAGNLSSVEVLLAAGADKNMKTKLGKTALDYARELHWEHIIPVLEKESAAKKPWWKL